ncbi:predicted protein [Aspergillus terreus NIH2624]|uniref:NADH dehydrogenase [ubiquinone] 1 alpha subcomplex assembly factor 3 n=1 Tax=Aspergillus terreus (strain NIH 2624 / FGSC A1156) TaxID=341663 RepID=Q0C9Q0_ASPTN|nr:uncharacterized protein ATEG_09584 [Aspergillus terreus NIH2624]EAU29775.1 predicted protein [Aspergillus terreus NIH2624]
MHPPSPQLLRALRTSIASSTPSGGLFCAPITRATSPISRLSTRHNSTYARPARMIPRSHTPKPTSSDRGPQSSETTQTDFAALDVLGSVPMPTTSVDATLDTGFHLNNGLKVSGGDGVLLVGGEAFAWRPWKAMADGTRGAMVNSKGQFEVDPKAWGLLDVVWPRPDLLLIGMGASVFPLAPETKRHINSLGVRVEVLDTRNAAAQFNMLATERGVNEIAAAMIPIGWKGGN